MTIEIHWMDGRFQQIKLNLRLNHAVAVAHGAIAEGAALANILDDGVLSVSVDCSGTTYYDA